MKISDKLQTMLSIAAVIGVLGGAYTSMWLVGDKKIEMLVAQELKARDYQMTYLMKQERTRDDNTQKEVCTQEGKTSGRCKVESDYRWALWTWQDCTAVGNGPEICRAKPEPPQ